VFEDEGDTIEFDVPSPHPDAKSTLTLRCMNGKAYMIKTVHACECPQHAIARQVLGPQCIVRGWSCGICAGGRCSVAMKYEGDDLLDATNDRARPLTCVEALRALACAADDVRCLNEAGFVHGDVKPDNILRNGKGLIDFGSLCELGRRTLLDGKTPGYFKPSMIGARLTPAFDCYSLAVTCGCVLLGGIQPPDNVELDAASAQTLWCPSARQTRFKGLVCELFNCSSAREMATLLRAAIPDRSKTTTV
jgi:serine/threonine protein kinase